MSDKIIHITVDEPTQDELAELRDVMQNALKDYSKSGKVVVSDRRMSMHEIPALDEYTDELADKIAERIE